MTFLRAFRKSSVEVSDQADVAENFLAIVANPRVYYKLFANQTFQEAGHKL